MSPIEILSGNTVIPAGEKLRVINTERGHLNIKSTPQGAESSGESFALPHNSMSEEGFYLINGTLMRVFSEKT